MDHGWIKMHRALLEKSIWTEATPRNRLITIVNWGIYQGSEEVETDELADSQQMANRCVTANKNVKNERKSNHRNSIYEESSEFYQIAVSLYKNIKLHHPGIREPNLQQWSDDMRLIVECDQRTIEQITHLITWSGQHA